MPPRSAVDRTTLDTFLKQHERVVSHADLRRLGMTKSSICRRILPEGDWQRGAPGVVIAHTGTPTRRELLLVALAYGGPGAVITGLDALAARGDRTTPRLDEPVRVLVPHGNQRSSWGQFRYEQSRRMPKPVTSDGIPYAPAARAVVDYCRACTDMDLVRATVARTVQWRRATLADLRSELMAAARQRTAAMRRVIAEVSAGVRSVAEAKAREVISRLNLPEPVWNVRLFTSDGALFLSPDAFWPLVAAAIEIDSLEWHLLPKDYRRTKARERRLVLNGVIVLSFTPAEIIENPRSFGRELAALLELAACRPVPADLRWELAPTG